MELEGRTAFITGGAQGIGLGIARALAPEGVKLAIADIDEAALESARAELAQTTAVVACVLDVRDREAYAKVADEVEAQLGPVSLLFNNAGVAGAVPITQISYEMWDWGIGINLGGVVNGIQTFLPRMIERGEGGHVVNTSSGAGLFASGSGHLYCTAKYAVVGMTESMRDELAAIRSGIGMSVLCPGPVATGIIDRSIEARPDNIQATNPQALTRINAMKGVLEAGVRPDDVGQMVLEGIRGNALYIFTDAIVAEPVKLRTQAILAAMPAVPDEDEEGQEEAGAGSAALDGSVASTSRPRKMRGYTVTAQVPASPDEAFALIADPVRAAAWTTSHHSFPDGPPTDVGPGSTYRQELLSMGQTSIMAWRVLSIDAPSAVEMEGDGPMGIKVHTRFDVAPKGDGSEVSITTEMGGGPLIGPLGKMALKASKEETTKSLEQLKLQFAW